MIFPRTPGRRVDGARQIVLSVEGHTARLGWRHGTVITDFDPEAETAAAMLAGDDPPYILDAFHGIQLAVRLGLIRSRHELGRVVAQVSQGASERQDAARSSRSGAVLATLAYDRYSRDLAVQNCRMLQRVAEELARSEALDDRRCAAHCQRLGPDALARLTIDQDFVVRGTALQTALTGRTAREIGRWILAVSEMPGWDEGIHLVHLMSINGESAWTVKPLPFINGDDRIG